MKAHNGMATLRMAQPWRDPKTGILYLRKRIPARYLPVTGKQGEQFKRSLKTKDGKAAKAEWPRALQEWNDKVAEWERLLNVVEATPAKVAEIAALWVARVGRTLTTDGRQSDVFDPISLPEARTPEGLAAMWDVIERHAAEAVELAGVSVSQATWPVLLQGMTEPVSTAYLQADLRHTAVWGSHPAVAPLDALARALPAPSEALKTATAATPTVTLTGLQKAWENFAAAKPGTKKETAYTIAALVKFAGHDDAAKLTKDTLRKWRDCGKAEGRSNQTWNNRLSLLSGVLKFGVGEDLLTENVAEGLRLEKTKAATRHPYDDNDAAKILTAARAEMKPALRWAHWVMAFTGMRAGEVLQLTRGDIRTAEGVNFIYVNEDAPSKTVKTGQVRNVPLHPALVDEGFLDYVRTIKGDEPIFPDKGLDANGLRGTRAWNVIGIWVRETVGLTDATKAPDHAWRHRMEDSLRDVEAPEDARDAILGHARKTTGRLYGARGESLKRLHRELAKVPVPAGVVMPAKGPATE